MRRPKGRKRVVESGNPTTIYGALVKALSAPAQGKSVKVYLKYKGAGERGREVVTKEHWGLHNLLLSLGIKFATGNDDPAGKETGDFISVRRNIAECFVRAIESGAESRLELLWVLDKEANR